MDNQAERTKKYILARLTRIENMSCLEFNPCNSGITARSIPEQEWRNLITYLRGY